MAEEPARLRDLLADAGRHVGLSAPVETGRLWARWREVVGEAIASHAEPTSLRDGVLRVRTDSPAWATEIGYLGEHIRRAANGALGRELVREVRVWTGPPGAPLVDRGGGRAQEAGDAAAREPVDDPLVALQRARRAWVARSATGAGRGWGGGRQTGENPR